MMFLGAPCVLNICLALGHAIWRKADPAWPVCGVPNVLSGTPKLILDRLRAVAQEAVADPEIAAKLKDLSAIVVGSTSEQLAAHVQAELTKWAPVVRASGAQLD
jgi:hypothetical protein